LITEVYEDPDNINDSLPTSAELTSGAWLDGGEPAVIAGSTLKELKDAAIALEAAETTA
jgi:hypothetical protein